MRSTFLCIGILAMSFLARAQSLIVSVQTSVPSPQPIETPVTLTMSATDTFPNPGALTFKVEVSNPSNAGSFRTLHDFAQATTFLWARNLEEGNYQLRVTARDSNYESQTAQIVIPFTMKAILTGTQPVVAATRHPLVAVFSAPPCPTGESMRVSFLASGSSAQPYLTNYSSCTGTHNMNFLVAGMIPKTTYVFTYQIESSTGIVTNGPSVSWTSGSLNSSLTLASVNFPVPWGSASSPERLLLVSNVVQATPDAVDNEGRVVWYYYGNGEIVSPGVDEAQIVRLISGGTMLVLTGYAGDWTGTGVYGNQTDHQVVQEMDMTGAVVGETNVDRVNEQLIAMGGDPISTFNHDARRLPNGDTMVVATVQKIYPAGTQGSTAPINILGTTLVELNENYQLVWYWECFDHLSDTELNINRVATLGEQCGPGSRGTSEGCPPVLISAPANDWLHTNTVQLQEDGSLIISMRNQDWVGKIDFGNGTGTGNVLWELGLDGNFSIVNSTNDPYPWFSHQHDAEIINSLETIIIFDNGNTRVEQNGGNSRGYVMNIDESTLVATTLDLYNMGYYAVAQGSAQQLGNGDYMFMGGQIEADPQYQYGAEFGLLSGNIVYSETSPHSEAYRVWRVPNLSNLPAN